MAQRRGVQPCVQSWMHFSLEVIIISDRPGKRNVRALLYNPLQRQGSRSSMTSQGLANVDARSYQSECPQDFAAQYAGLPSQTSRAQWLARNHEETSPPSTVLQAIVDHSALKQVTTSVKKKQAGLKLPQELHRRKFSKFCCTHRQST